MKYRKISLCLLTAWCSNQSVGRCSTRKAAKPKIAFYPIVEIVDIFGINKQRFTYLQCAVNLKMKALADKVAFLHGLRTMDTVRVKYDKRTFRTGEA